ncbi:MAG: hypothetical protein ACRENP_19150 [Longimicrobiales bacterium]
MLRTKLMRSAASLVYFHQKGVFDARAAQQRAVPALERTTPR